MRGEKPERQVEVYIDSDGTIETFDGFKMEQAGMDMCHLGGTFKTERVAHIYPVKRLKRWMFRLIRMFSGDTGKVANWTRKWKGSWQVVRVDNPKEVIYLALTRDACISFERDHMRKVVIERHKEQAPISLVRAHSTTAMV